MTDIDSTDDAISVLSEVQHAAGSALMDYEHELMDGVIDYLQATDQPELPFGENHLLNVDFDNTITKSNVEYWNGERPEPDPAVAQAVREHYYRGGYTVIWTARPWSEAHRIAAHLTEWQIPYHGIRCSKGSGDHYVDDKIVSPATLAGMVDGDG